jgi:hypothetical protein
VNYTIVKEPRGVLYGALLDHALGACTKALLVLREDLGLEEQGRRCLEALGPFVTAVEDKSSWPGTELSGHTAKVYSFRYDRASAEILPSFSEGLYDWVQPGLPEDLCLLREDGQPWLVTIAHESDAFLRLTEREAATALSRLSGLELKAVPDCHRMAAGLS